jgi:hypothetical protein
MCWTVRSEQLGQPVSAPQALLHYFHSGPRLGSANTAAVNSGAASTLMTAQHKRLVSESCAAWHVVLQVEQILNLRTDLMEAAEKLRRSEAERQTLESDITTLRQQVRTGAAYAASTIGRSCRQLVASSGRSSTATAACY